MLLACFFFTTRGEYLKGIRRTDPFLISRPTVALSDVNRLLANLGY